MVRVSGATGPAIAALRGVVAALDAELPLYQVTTMSRLADAALARDRFTALVLGASAPIALALAAVGIFGVFAGEVARRRKELGIRLAVGATPGRIVIMVLVHALRRAAVGIAFGAALALALARLMTSLLFGIEPYDPLSFLSVSALLFVLAAAATVAPTIRALRASPLAALREG